MTERRRRVFKWLSFILALALFIGFGQKYVFRNMDEDQRRIEGFYMEKPDSLDVVFLGSSEVFADFSAAQAYQEFGFTSYPYATNANPVTLWKYELKEIIDRQHPKLIVVETNGALYGKKRLFRETSLRRIVDNMPESPTRKSMISDMGKDERLSYYLPMLKYHNVWENPQLMIAGTVNTLSLHLRGNAYLKGIKTNTIQIKGNELYDIHSDVGGRDLSDAADEALRDFLEYCRQEKIENIVFARFPHRVTQAEESCDRFLRNKTAAKIIKSYGFDYVDLDMCEDEIGLDMADDFYNDEHLNVHGMKKMTSWFGRYLIDHYAVKPQTQSDENALSWGRSVAYTEAFYDYYDELIKGDRTVSRELTESAGVIHKLKSMLKNKMSM